MVKKIEKLEDVRPDEKNANKGTERGRYQLEESLRRYGAGRSILTDKNGTTIAGAKTLEAAADIGLAVRVVQTDGNELVVVQRTDLDLEDGTAARELAYADNRVGEVSLAWDVDIIAADIADGIDLTAFWKEDELAELLASIQVEVLPQSDPDDVPQLPGDEPISKQGDVILLGRHRLLCGDSTNLTDVELVMDGKQADMVWTDPPYGVSYVGKTKDALTIENDALSETDLETLLRESLTNVWSVCRSGATWYVAGPPAPLQLAFAVVLHELDVWRQTLIWVKNSLVLGHSDYHYRHEPIFYGWKQGDGHVKPMNGQKEDRSQDSIWEIDRPSRSTDHPTMKPAELVERSIKNSSKKGAIVLDPFGGSGTTVIAAENTGRTCYTIELDPKYCDVIVKRWEEFTGMTAQRPT